MLNMMSIVNKLLIIKFYMKFKLLRNIFLFVNFYGGYISTNCHDTLQ